MKKIFLILICFLGLYACSDDVEDQMDGFWQLKTIEKDGEISQVDTVFYGFQRKALFSYTITSPTDPNETILSYGYIQYPTENEILITMDPRSVFYDFSTLTGWESTEEKFTIESVNSKNLILKNGNKTYFFKRF